MDIQQLTTDKMSLVLMDTGRSITIITPKLVSFLLDTLSVCEEFLWKQLKFSQMKFPMVEFSVAFCGVSRIKTLNRDHRGKNQRTDVLSFPVHENPRQRNNLEELRGVVLNLGDIFICKEVAVSQSADFGITFEQELVHLMVHGFLHLCGFDHELSQREEEMMSRHEERLISKIYKELGWKSQ